MRKDKIIKINRFGFYTFFVAFLVIIIAVFISFKKKYIDIYPKSDNTYFLLSEAINEGNAEAFEKVISDRSLLEGDTELFFYAFLMANKHHDWRACYFVFRNLRYEKNNQISVNGIQYFSNDKNTQGLAIYYLLKSYEYGNPDTSKYELKQYFKEKIPNSDEYFVNFLQKGNKKNL